MEQSILLVWVFLLGLAVGSFMNVVVLRVNASQAPTGRSRCPHCTHVLAGRDLVPLLSFVWLRGRCRYCRQPIHWRYPVVEVLMGLAFVLVTTLVGWQWALLPTLLTTTLVIGLFWSDAWFRTVPDVLSVPAMVVGFGTAVLIGTAWHNSLLAGAIGAAFFGLQYVLSRGRWVGDGDIRLGAIMGLLLGVSSLLVALVMAYLVGAVVALLLLLRRQATLKTQLPFGALLMPATLISLVAGSAIAEWYLAGGFFRASGLDALIEWIVVRVYGL